MQSRGRMQVDRIRAGPVGPYNRGHTGGHTSYSHRNSKPLYPPSRRYEILLEAGRLATEYLVSTGALPPNFKGPNGNYPDFKGQNSQNPPRRFDDDYDRYRVRKSGRGKRQKAFYNRKDSFEWERENKSRNSNSRNNSNSYSDDEEEEEEYSRYRRERKEKEKEKESNFDEVASRVSGSIPVKREGKGESGSDLEDTGSKEGSCSIKKDQQLETGEVSNLETGEVNKVELDNNNNINDNNEKGNNNDENDNKTLLDYCEFAKIPTKPRTNNNRGELVDPNINEDNRSDNPVENRDNNQEKSNVTEEVINSFAQPIILEEEEDEEEDEIKKEEELEASSDQTGTGLVSETGHDPDAASFKTCDLNLTGMGEITEIPDDVAHDSKENEMNFGDFNNNNNDDNDGNNDYDNNNNNDSNNGNNEVVQVIHIEDDSPAHPKENVEELVAYQNSENILTNITNEDVMPSINIQDGFNLTLSDFLGSDIACCYPIQPDLQAGVIPGVDDPIYGSLGDIGFMWDQPPQDYERFF